jgi:non-heme chloroperoxidase
MGFATAKDGTRIFFKDSGGAGPAIVFSHGWPLSCDAWDNQFLHFGMNGFRVVAHDRRGHGKSDGSWEHNDLDTYADDLAAVMDHLDLGKVVLVGHSTGGGEVTRYIGRHGTARVAKLVLVGAIPPLMLKTPANPEGTPLEAFDGIRKGVRDDRAQFFKDLTMPFYGFNRPGAKISEGLRESFWLMGMEAAIKGAYDCIKAFSETDLTEDLEKVDVPTLIVHGDDDQIVPIQAAAMKSSKLVGNATLKVYPGAPHGLAQTMADRFNADLMAFIKG